MSNARSPRDVCSTTMGTRGLIALASFRLVGSNPSQATRGSCVIPVARPMGQSSNGFWPLRPAFRPGVRPRSGARRPQLLIALFLLLVGRPDLAAGLGLLDRDRRGVLDQRVERLAHRDVLAQQLVAALLARLLERPAQRLLAQAALAAAALGQVGLTHRVEQL